MSNLLFTLVINNQLHFGPSYRGIQHFQLFAENFVLSIIEFKSPGVARIVWCRVRTEGAVFRALQFKEVPKGHSEAAEYRPAIAIHANSSLQSDQIFCKTEIGLCGALLGPKC